MKEKVKKMNKKKRKKFYLYNYSSDEHVRETFSTLNNIDNKSMVDPREAGKLRLQRGNR
jgi:hypothetical protein